jgi:hypothetical protein
MMFSNNGNELTAIVNEAQAKINAALSQIEAYKAQKIAVACSIYQAEEAAYGKIHGHFRMDAYFRYGKVYAYCDTFVESRLLNSAMADFPSHEDILKLSEQIESVLNDYNKKCDALLSAYKQDINARIVSYQIEKQKELCLAAIFGATSKIKALVEAGAKPNEPVHFEGLATYPLDRAIINLQSETVRELIRLGASLYSPEALSQAQKKVDSLYSAHIFILNLPTFETLASRKKADAQHKLQEIITMIGELGPGSPSSVTTFASSAAEKTEEGSSPLSLGH